MKISAEEIKKIALLSRLNVEDDQIETVGKQLNDILAYMDLLNQVDITDVQPTVHAIPLHNVMCRSRRCQTKRHSRTRRNRKTATSKYQK